MLLDLLSTSNQISFNIKVAQLFGLKEAVYLSELMVINEKAIRKNKIEEIDGKKFFTVARSYITAMTTLTNAEQKEIEKNLNQFGIIRIMVDRPDTLYLDINRLGVLIGGDLDKSVVNDLKKLANQKTKDEKRKSKYASLKVERLKVLKETNPDVRTAYANWIEAALQRYGGSKFSDQTVRLCERQINDFAKGNSEIAIEVINLNIGYNTMQFAIDKYKELYPSSIPQVAAKKAIVRAGSEVF